MDPLHIQSCGLGRLSGLESQRAGVNGEAGFSIDSILEASEPSKPRILEASEASCLETWRSGVKGPFDTSWIPYRFNPGGLGA